MPTAKQTGFKRIVSLSACEAVPCYNSADKLTGFRTELYDVGGTEDFASIFRETKDAAERDAELIVTAVNQHAANLEAIRELRAALTEMIDASMDFRLHSTAHPRLVSAESAARAALAKHPQP